MPRFGFDVMRILNLLSLLQKQPLNQYQLGKSPEWRKSTARRYLEYCTSKKLIDPEVERPGFYRVSKRGEAFLALMAGENEPAGTGIYVRS